MNSKTLACAIAAAAAVAALAAAPANATTTNDDDTSFGLLGWYNDPGHWGYTLNPTSGQCSSLTPDAKKDAFIGNWTEYKAVFYTAEDCNGEPAYEVGAYTTLNGTEKDAKSVEFLPTGEVPGPTDPTVPPTEPGPDNPGPLPPTGEEPAPPATS